MKAVTTSHVTCHNVLSSQDCRSGRGPPSRDSRQRRGQPLCPLRDHHRESEGQVDPPRQWESLQPRLQPSQGESDNLHSSFNSKISFLISQFPGCREG